MFKTPVFGGQKLQEKASNLFFQSETQTHTSTFLLSASLSSVCLGCRMPPRCSGTDESFSLRTWPGTGPGWTAYHAHSQDIAGSSTHTSLLPTPPSYPHLPPTHTSLPHIPPSHTHSLPHTPPFPTHSQDIAGSSTHTPLPVYMYMCHLYNCNKNAYMWATTVWYFSPSSFFVSFSLHLPSFFFLPRPFFFRNLSKYAHPPFLNEVAAKSAFLSEVRPPI